jgi:signal transduction histidine kinase
MAALAAPSEGAAPAAEGEDEEVILHFGVVDTGCGVARDKRAYLFKPFSQADASTTRRFGGTGLGLAIAASIAHIMGGHMWYQVRLGFLFG